MQCCLVFSAPALNLIVALFQPGRSHLLPIRSGDVAVTDLRVKIWAWSPRRRCPTYSPFLRIPSSPSKHTWSSTVKQTFFFLAPSFLWASKAALPRKSVSVFSLHVKRSPPSNGVSSIRTSWCQCG